MTEKAAQKEPGKKPVPSKKPKPQQEVVVQIPLSELHPFPDHPFQVREDTKWFYLHGCYFFTRPPCVCRAVGDRRTATGGGRTVRAVSYTHLTLPTKRIV